jgi:hypothetical protein
MLAWQQMVLMKGIWRYISARNFLLLMSSWPRIRELVLGHSKNKIVGYSSGIQPGGREDILGGT